MAETPENIIYLIIDSKDPAYRLAVNKLFHNKFDLQERECYTTIVTKFGVFKIIAYHKNFLDRIDPIDFMDFSESVDCEQTADPIHECDAKKELLENASYIKILESVYTHPEDCTRLLLTDILNVSFQELHRRYIMPIILKYIEKNITPDSSIFD
jgi:hypothetical protein